MPRQMITVGRVMVASSSRNWDAILVRHIYKGDAHTEVRVMGNSDLSIGRKSREH